MCECSAALALQYQPSTAAFLEHLLAALRCSAAWPAGWPFTPDRPAAARRTFRGRAVKMRRNVATCAVRRLLPPCTTAVHSAQRAALRLCTRPQRGPARTAVGEGLGMVLLSCTGFTVQRVLPRCPWHRLCSLPDPVGTAATVKTKAGEWHEAPDSENTCELRMYE